MPLIASHHITVIRFYRAAVILLCILLHVTLAKSLSLVVRTRLPKWYHRMHIQLQL